MRKRIVILGAGCAGTMIANQLRCKLRECDYKITVIDKDNQHLFQPGLLFVPFGLYQANELTRTRSQFFVPDVDFLVDDVIRIDPEKQQVVTTKNTFGYDKLIIATGLTIDPEEVDGLMDGWQKTVFDFYSLNGAVNLEKALRSFQGGKLVINIAEVPFKCPVSPLEFMFLADWYFTERGIRDKVELELVTPLPEAFTKPKASAFFTKLCAEKNIKTTPNFDLAEVDTKGKKIISAMDDEIEYDLLVSIPPHVGAKILTESGVGDMLGFVNVDKHTLKSKMHPNVYAVGDVANIPASKAATVAYFAVETLVGNFMRECDGLPPLPFDGHANCFVETGFNKASLIDFNYDYEPLPGKFPLPGVGPFTLLKETSRNHWGKMMFRWVYWNKMMRGQKLPLRCPMQLAGKYEN